jgi:glycosyltransferase involved in cell wall biosynthesis
VDTNPAERSVDRSITALVVNYRTAELTRRCVDSLLAQYPTVQLLVIDNNSADESTAYVSGLATEHENVRVQLNDRNIYHGPALDQGLRLAQTPFVFTLDSDCEVFGSGFLEQMLSRFDDPLLYAVGELRYKNRFGYTYANWDVDGRDRPAWIPYIHPYAMLLDRRKYLTLPPFIHHGAPCIKNMRAARRAGYVVRHFPVYEVVRHEHGGTSRAHGYGFWGRGRLTAGFYAGKVYDRLVGDRTWRVRYPPDR